MYEELVSDLHKGYTDRLKEAADAIEELSKPRWIPVTERLPGYGDWVLGIGPKHGYHVCEYRGITHFPYSGDIPWFSAKGRTLTITHWMPFPTPPKEEERMTVTCTKCPCKGACDELPEDMSCEDVLAYYAIEPPKEET